VCAELDEDGKLVTMTHPYEIAKRGRKTVEEKAAEEKLEREKREKELLSKLKEDLGV
jgi:hypothetical protein